MSYEIPQKYRDLVGTTQSFSGGIFGENKDWPITEFKVLDIKGGGCTVINMKEARETGESSYEHPTFKLKLFRKGMKRAQWSRAFPIREINLKEGGKK